MRARSIKPGFFQNEELVKLPEAVRLLFIGLWCMADRRGRLEDRPAKIKMMIYPCDQHDISTMLAQLQHHAFILRYEKKGNHYIQIINFEKHQYPHIREAESIIPAPDKHHTSTMPARLTAVNGVTESCVLNPDSMQSVFDELWKKYPKRLGRKEALRHFTASVKTGVDVKNIRCALQKYLAYLKESATEPRYIKQGSTWFNQWSDWIDFKGENKDDSDGRASVSEFTALARANREAEELRKKESEPRTLPARI